MQKVSAKQVLMEKLEKTAVPSMTFGQALGIGAALTGTAMAARAGSAGIGSLYTKFKSERMFKELTNRYPEIKRHPKAREYFDLIVAYAPSLLKHPTAIGDFLRRQLEYPMSSIEFVKQLADLEKTVASTPSIGESVSQTLSHSTPGSNIMPF